jgi:hypothetical protein
MSVSVQPSTPHVDLSVSSKSSMMTWLSFSGMVFTLESRICVAERNAVCVFPCCSLGGEFFVTAFDAMRFVELGAAIILVTTNSRPS